MAATANAPMNRRTGDRANFPIAAATTIYQAMLVFLNASGQATGSTGSGNNRLAGVAIEEQDNAAGAAGDLRIEVWRRGAFLLAGSGFAAGDEGKEVYASDSNTVSLTPTGNVRIGRIVEVVSATAVWVDIEPTDQIVASITNAAAAGTSQSVTIQLSRPGVQRIEWYMATSAAGAASSSGAGTGVTASTGTSLSQHTAKLHGTALTDSTGKLVLAVNNASGGGEYTDRVAVLTNDGRLTVGDALAVPNS